MAICREFLIPKPREVVLEYGLPTPMLAMNNYTIWAQIRTSTEGEFEVSVRAIPLGDNVSLGEGEVVLDHCAIYDHALARCATMVKRLKEKIEDRGDRVLSIDSTISSLG